MRPRLAAALAGVVLAGCMVGPDYRRPDVATPPAYRGQTGAAEAASLGDLPWWEVFRDPALQALVREALANNLDLKQAIARVEQARALVKVVGAPLYPQLGYGASAARQSGPSVGVDRIDTITYNAFGGALNLSWEIDLWGKVRRASEAAQADLLATEAYRRGVTVTLLADVASNYFQLVTLDRELAIARATVASYRKTLALFQERNAGGAASMLPVNRAAAQLANAAADIPQIERRIVDAENRLSVLVGRVPGPVARNGEQAALPAPPDVPAGLPAQLLERRPDVRQSEDLLIAANARVGVATANFYPSISLTGLLGVQHSSVSSILSGTSSIWNLGAGLLGPLFTGGQLTGELEAQEAQWRRAKASYEQTVLTALAEVGDALNGREKLAAMREQREIAVREFASSVELSLDRYLLGLASYFEVLQTQEQLYSTQLALARTQGEALVNVVQLYRALGGGWQTPPAGERAADGTAAAPAVRN